MHTRLGSYHHFCESQFQRLVFAFFVFAISLPPLGRAQAPSSSYRPENPDLMVRAATYQNGRVEELIVDGRYGFIIRPNGPLDRERRWVWDCPSWYAVLSAPPPRGTVAHRFYVESLLARGFCVGGVDVGISCGSPAAAKVCNDFYDMVLRRYRLNPRVRMIGQSNGGLIAYAWAFRHPKQVDRILGIYPSTDMRTWPGLDKVTGPGSWLAVTAPELQYDITLQALETKLNEFNPIDNLKPLAEAGVAILHLHGDQDSTVPIGPNSEELVERYRKLGGEAEIVVFKGRKHGPTGGPEFHDEIFYTSERALQFLIDPCCDFEHNR